MKTYIAIISLFLFVGLGHMSQAQTDSVIVVIDDTETEENDTTEVKIGKNIRIVFGSDSELNLGKDKNDDDESNSNVEFIALDIGISNYAGSGGLGVDAAGDPRLELTPFRPGAHVAIHFLPTEVNLIGKGAVSFKTALTIDWNNYYFSNDITLSPRQDNLTIIDANPDAPRMVRNKLTTRYFQLPLLLNFNTDPKNDKGLELAVGGFAGVLWGAHTKQRNEVKELVKIRDDFNLNPWRYGLMARIGVRWLDIYVQYNLSEMFADGQGPSTQTFNIGLNLIDF